MKRRRAALGLALALAAATAIWIVWVPYPIERVERSHWGSTQIQDRHGEALRDVLDGREGRSVRVGLDEVSEWVVAATLAGEDHRFEAHIGVDPWAIVRAVVANLEQRRIYSGASTLTMQLVRMIEHPGEPRSIELKLIEAVQSLRMERALSKDEILAHYLNRAPYGNGTHGVEAASRLYFGKHARDLSLAEASFLATLPRSPSGYDPYRHFDRAQRRQRHLLSLMRERGEIDEAAYTRALDQALVILPRRAPFEAPHFVDAVISRHKAPLSERPETLTTTLSLRVQRPVEAAVARHLESLSLRGATQAAVVVIDNPTGEVLAMVGSRDWHDRDGHGQVNGALALRQPGSTLKPFTYALAFEQGASPATVLADVPTDFVLGPGQTYTPQNFDLRFRGPVRAREALAGSLNVPAVRILRDLGPRALLDRLHRLGVESLDKPAGHYGLGLTLGDGEVSLLELVGAFAALARGGLWRPTHLITNQPEGSTRRVFSPEVAHMVTDVLSDELARAAAFGVNTPFSFPYPVAVKTGTSAGVRDTWSVGYTPSVTVGVWVGRFDGGRLSGLSGVVGAGPLFREVMDIAMRGRPHQSFEEPGGLEHAEVCALSGHKPGPHCPHRLMETFPRGQAPTHTCTWHQALAIDRRNGLLAGPNCPSRHVIERRFTVLPDATYADWTQARALTRPPRAHSPFCPGSDARPPELEIVSPQPGEVFLLDPSRSPEVQTIRLVARATRPARMRHMAWHLDGEALALTHADLTGSQISGRWTPHPGEHTLQAVLPDGTLSTPVEIVVK